MKLNKRDRRATRARSLASPSRGRGCGRDVLRGGSIFLLLMAVDDSLIVTVAIGY
jgi:hypothetical protein